MLEKEIEIEFDLDNGSLHAITLTLKDLLDILAEHIDADELETVIEYLKTKIKRR